MAYRFKTRSTTPDDYRLTSAAIALLGYTYGDEDASQVLTTADGAGTYQPVLPRDVQEDVPVGVSPTVGTFVAPSEDQVQSGVEFGNNGEYVGTLDVAAAEAAAYADGEAAQHAADALFLSLNTDEMIAANDSIQAEFTEEDVEGDAPAGEGGGIPASRIRLGM